MATGGSPEGRQRSNARGRRIFFGVLLLTAAPVIILAGYASVPYGGVCVLVNRSNTQLGQPLSCSTIPSMGYFVVAGICFVAGLLMLAPWWLGWLVGSSGRLLWDLRSRHGG
jgi:hypothetical protein